MRAAIRHDWSVDEIRAIYEGPLLELVFEAARVHRQYHDPAEVQVCKLVSIKTGGCAEDCGYCSQSAWYETGIAPQPLMDKETVVMMATARPIVPTSVRSVSGGMAMVP
jgi:biotin synthase